MAGKRRKKNNASRSRAIVFVTIALVAVTVLIVFGLKAAMKDRRGDFAASAPAGNESGNAAGESSGDGEGSAGGAEDADPENGGGSENASAETEQDAGTGESTPENETSSAEEDLEGVPEEELYRFEEGQLRRGDLILVNAEHEYSFEDNPDSTLAMVAAARGFYYPIGDGDAMLQERIMPFMDEMIRACGEALGTADTGISSAYRSLKDQQSIWDQYEELYGEGYCEKYVAVPGFSEHHTGLAADMSIYYGDGFEDSFSGSQNAAWMDEHCADYGFVRRYRSEKADITGYNNEAWHFRYVGLPHAYYMETQGLCLEEYIDELRSYSKDDPLMVSCPAGTFRIWFTKSDVIRKPEGEFTVSGNNVDGYVVTETAEAL